MLGEEINKINELETKAICKKNNRIYLIVKRIFDFIIGMIGCIFLLPVSVIVKIINISCKDYGPLFFAQIRIGKDGKKFKLYKYRTMLVNSEEILEELLNDEEYKKEWDENQKFSNDPRITKAGRFLRKTSLDELPQFINVLIGDMSCIGPRPLVEGELDSHSGNHVIYQSVRPGISGWWACNGRSNITYEERLELEYYYVKNCSLLLDIKCILKTLEAVLIGKGAK